MIQAINYSSPLFIFGLLGVLVSVLLKVKDINDGCTECTFKSVWSKFIKTDWPSFSVSLIIVLVAAITHNEWGGLGSDNVPGDGIFEKILSAPNIVMFFVGLVGQWAVYKYWLGKRKSAIQEKE